MKAGYFLTFAIGAFAGAGVSYLMSRSYYLKKLDEEAASIMAEFSKDEPLVVTLDDEDSDISEEEGVPDEPEIIDIAKEREEAITRYNEIVHREGYTAPSEERDTIEIIHPEDMGETGYEKVELKLYEDGVFVDEVNDIVDAEDFIGLKRDGIIKAIGIYEPDSACIRNHERKIDVLVIETGEPYEEE